MMLLKKDTVLFVMKLVTVLFLILMITKVAKLFSLPDEFKEEKEKNSYKIAFEDDIINKPYFFHVFAFVLGAFWNIKRIVKIGII